MELRLFVVNFQMDVILIMFENYIKFLEFNLSMDSLNLVIGTFMVSKIENFACKMVNSKKLSGWINFIKI